MWQINTFALFGCCFLCEIEITHRDMPSRKNNGALNMLSAISSITLTLLCLVHCLVLLINGFLRLVCL